MTGVAPWLPVRNAAEALAYCTAAFGAIELEGLEDDAGEVVLAQLAIDGADFWIQTDPSGHHWEIGRRLTS